MSKGTNKFNKALSLFNSNKLAEARNLLNKITITDKRKVDAWLLLGMTEARMGSFGDAAACFGNILSISPDSADAHYYLGTVLEAQNNYTDAIKEYKATIQLQSDYFKAHYNLGNIYRAQGLLEKAEEYYRSALYVNPHYFEALNNLGSVLKTQSKLEEAVNCFYGALHIKPGDAGILTNLGNTFHLLEQYEEAEKYYRQALKVSSGLSEAFCGLSGVLFKKGDKEKALELLAEARCVLPDDGSVIASEATIYEQAGQYNDAYNVLRQKIEDKCDSVDITLTFGRFSRHIGLAEEAIELLEEQLEKNQCASDRMRICFVLGKLYDSLGKYGRAFDSLSKGNKLKPFSLDRNVLGNKFDRIISVFNSGFMSSSSGSGNTSSKPVFVVGMPRSGTSLVEQILSSHPDVFGAGELMDVGTIAAYMQAELKSVSTYPECVNELAIDSLNEYAARYEKKLEVLAPGAKRVIDKMPGNFMHIGLIELMFPEARIIHCVRNPLDTCLSCYFTDFLGYHPYAYDQSDLGFYYCQYHRLMEHWKTVISLPLYTVEYEALVNNQGKISRELVDFCDLEWNDRCLAFHETKRLVKTASYDQVRKPMYKSSIGRSVHYRDKLGTLINALDKCRRTSENRD